MEILKISGEPIGLNKVTSTITANLDTKSIDILGYDFDSKSLTDLFDWTQQYKLQNKKDITLNFLAYKGSIGNGFFNMASHPIQVGNKRWKSLINYDINQNELGKTLSLLKRFNFTIEGTDSTMNIQGHFNKGEIKILGCFVDYEPVLEFFPLIAWLENYILLGKKNLTVHLRLDYFNTGMSKVIKEFFSFLKESKLEFEIIWFYPDDDIDMETAGKEYRSLMDFTDKIMRVVSMN